MLTASAARADEPVAADALAPTDADGIALIAPPAPLEAAVIAQLGPWRITIVTVPGPAPTDAADAFAIAAHQQVRAVVWVAGDQVVIFDARDGHQVTRPLGALDPAGAAAIALTVKTVVRGPTQVAPAVVSEPASVQPPPPLIASPTPIPPPIVTRESPRWSLAARGGLRWHGEGVEPRLGLAASRRLGPVAVGLAASFGAGVAARTVDFAGTWRDQTLGARAGLPLARGALVVTPAVGPSLHLTSIRGALSGAGEAQRHATTLGLDAEVEARWQRGPLAVGAVLGATWIPWRERYTVAGAPAFVVGHGEVEAAIMVGVVR